MTLRQHVSAPDFSLDSSVEATHLDPGITGCGFCYRAPYCLETTLPGRHPAKPLTFHHPLLMTEKSAECDLRVDWLSYLSDQIRLAIQSDAPGEGICCYLIVDFPA